MSELVVVVIGAGAAGFYGAITCAASNPKCRVILLEKTRAILSKVKISGGGRCNVTHACFEPATLIQNYPRGSKELLGPFTRFGPKEVIRWFEEKGVPLKVEGDGRMFPVTDSSETIIQCLTSEAKALNVQLMPEKGVLDCVKENNRFQLSLTNGETLFCDKILVASGGTFRSIQPWLEKLGHTFSPAVPSLFTFNIPGSPLKELSGISVPLAHLTIAHTDLQSTGPLLMTHWGFSGPAVLKLSAWGARVLHDMNYKGVLQVNWMAKETKESLKGALERFKLIHPTKQVATDSPFPLPKSLWKALIELALISAETKWANLSKGQMQKIIDTLHSSSFQIDGKSTYKEEFVTCGGVKLKEVNFKTMESRLCPNLHFAGEVLDIDGITGGFNFQAAWTTSFLAGQAMACV